MFLGVRGFVKKAAAVCLIYAPMIIGDLLPSLGERNVSAGCRDRY